jgi:senataxin
MQSGDSEVEPFTGRLAGRVTVDDFTEIFISVDRLGERNAISENDVVMLTGPAQTIGKIHQVIRKPQKIDVVIRCHLGKDDGSVSRALMNGTNWTIRKLFS